MQNLGSIKVPTYSLLRDYSTVIYPTMAEARDRNCVKEKDLGSWNLDTLRRKSNA